MSNASQKNGAKENVKLLNISLLDKVFQVKCTVDKIKELNDAADRLDKEMRKMRQAGVVGLDRIAVITALNLTRLVNELEKNLNNNVHVVSSKVKGIQKRIDDSLTHIEQLEL
ncbi:MAG: hypothetical protein A3E87_09365 [Gammaproteobacteria bacterium RIFCSPHIGHO2_12_FULL_35_23]|nr:MAG: hypothetical protein A3E87_09365 [Gammaproteobacteria bacterium RIFCSPHIGHO2_12_FULL_35_23]